MNDKPYKGMIFHWQKVDISSATSEGLGYKILGKPFGHPTIVDWILTSLVLKELDDGYIETLNSVYKLSKATEEPPEELNASTGF